MIEYKCAACGAAMSSPDSMASQTEKCPACGHVTGIPSDPATILSDEWLASPKGKAAIAARRSAVSDNVGVPIPPSVPRGTQVYFLWYSAPCLILAGLVSALAHDAVWGETGRVVGPIVGAIMLCTGFLLAGILYKKS